VAPPFFGRRWYRKRSSFSSISLSLFPISGTRLSALQRAWY